MNLLNNNPVLVARHFQYKFELFFKEIIIHGVLDKTKFYTIYNIESVPHPNVFWTYCFLEVKKWIV